MREKRFIVKPEEKVVVAIMDAYCDGIQEEVEKKSTRLTANLVQHIITNDYRKGLNYPNYEIHYNVPYKGVSKCDKDDEFDEKKGKNIAGNKADMKYHIAMMKKYKRLKDIFAKASDEMYELEMEHLNKVDNIKESLQKYSIRQDV